MGSNPGYLLKPFLLYKSTFVWEEEVLGFKLCETFGRLELHTTVIRVDDVVFVVLCTNGIIPSSCRWHFLTRFSTHRRGWKRPWSFCLPPLHRKWWDPDVTPQIRQFPRYHLRYPLHFSPRRRWWNPAGISWSHCSTFGWPWQWGCERMSCE